MKTLMAGLILLALGACDAAKHYGEVSISRKKEYNDNQAGLYVQVPCDMTIGAYIRTLSDVQQRAVWNLCGGDQETHMTAEDVQAVQDFLELRARSQ